MVARAFLIFLFLSIYGFANPTQCQQNVPRPGIFSGIQALGNVISTGLRQQGSILSSGIKNTTNQIRQLATDLTQQTAEIISSGKERTRSAVEEISLPGLTSATLVLIGNFNYFMRTSGRDTVKISPINSSLSGMGTLQTSEGKISKFSTLRLDGRLNVTAGLTSLRLAIPLALSELSVSFDSYLFSTWGVSMNGSLNARIGNNSFIAHVVMRPGIGCIVNVEKVEVSRLQGIDLQMTGLCSWCSSIASYIANYLQGVIQAEVQKAVDGELKSVLKEKSLVLCSNPVSG